VKKETTALSGVYILEPNVFADHRGFFMESYNDIKLRNLGIEAVFVQDNHSLSVDIGVIRGMHYQALPKAQTKLVRVVSGAVYDVVVDLRKSSPTFGKWIGVELSSDNKKQIYIPVGFAHGYCTLLPNTEVLYKVDEYYSPEHDRGILWSDSELGIDWPTSEPILSDKDHKHSSFRNAEYFD
jgi:dTDP-4-dehydrorhamnose 3,5-epimerase